MTQETRIARRPQQELAVPITKEQAMYLLKTIWPKAPEIEVIKAGILCQQYGLNPLMRQVYLIQFGQDWVTVLGIKATRQIAQQALTKRGIHYSYQDGPRVMNEKEQMKIRGKVETDKIWAITILADSAGNTYPGYGFWPANKQPYGVDKGNDALNMAFIRSERNALDKLAPGELPDIEVADDNFIVADYRKAIEQGKDQFQRQVQQDIKDNWPEDPEAPTSTLASGINQGIEVESSGNLPDEQKEAPETDTKLTDLLLQVKEGMEQTRFKLPTLKSWLRSKVNYTGLDTNGELEDIIKRMNQEQRQFLLKELQERLAMR